MINIFREKSFVAIFGLVFFLFLFHFHIFFQPVQITISKNSGVLSLFLENIGSKIPAFTLTILYPIFICFQALRLNIILNNNRMYAKTGYTIAFAYVLLTGLITSCYNFSAALIINSFVILLFNLILKLYNNVSSKALLFNIGLLTSAMIIAYYPCVFLLPFVFTGLAILKPFKTQEWFILLLGILAPLYLLFGILFLIDYNFKQIILYKINFLLFIKSTDVDSILKLCSIGFLVVISLLIWYPNSNRLIIQIRKNWGVMLVLFLLLILTIPFYTKTKMLPFVACLVPLSAFVANAFVYPKKTFWLNILVLILTGITIYNNFSVA